MKKPLQSRAAYRSLVLKMIIWGVPWLVGCNCNYLLPKQTGGTTQILIFKTLRTKGRPTLYVFHGALYFQQHKLDSRTKNNLDEAEKKSFSKIQIIALTIGLGELPVPPDPTAP